MHVAGDGDGRGVMHLSAHRFSSEMEVGHFRGHLRSEDGGREIYRTCRLRLSWLDIPVDPSLCT